MRTLLALLAAFVLGAPAAADPVGDLQALTAKPESRVTYWRISDDWSDRDAVVTLDERTIFYSAKCGRAPFPYGQHREFGGQLGAWPAFSPVCDHDPAFDRFASALDQADAVRGRARRLAFLRINAPLLRLARFEPDGIEFRRWIVSKYRDGDALVAPELSVTDCDPGRCPETMPPPTITFDRGALEGSAGCGALAGGYRIPGARLSIGAGFNLRGWCPQSAMDENARVLAALNRVRGVARDGPRMLLKGAQGEVEIVLARA